MCLFYARLFCVFSALAIVTVNLVVEEEGQVSRALNYAVIEVSLREQGRDPGANLLNLRACVDGVINALKQNGIDEKTHRDPAVRCVFRLRL
jgi:uncharacterized protein YggE